MFIEKKINKYGHSYGSDLFIFRFIDEEDRDCYLDSLDECADYLDATDNERVTGDELRRLTANIRKRTTDTYANADGKFSGFLYAEEMARFAEETSCFFIRCNDERKGLEETCKVLDDACDRLKKVCDDYRDMFSDILGHVDDTKEGCGDSDEGRETDFAGKD